MFVPHHARSRPAMLPPLAQSSHPRTSSAARAVPLPRARRPPSGCRHCRSRLGVAAAVSAKLRVALAPAAAARLPVAAPLRCSLTTRPVATALPTPRLAPALSLHRPRLQPPPIPALAPPTLCSQYAAWPRLLPRPRRASNLAKAAMRVVRTPQARARSDTSPRCSPKPLSPRGL